MIPLMMGMVTLLTRPDWAAATPTADAAPISREVPVSVVMG
jgi:hypothetical protein